ncbi:hypothetical protein ACJ41O_004698 [Fusarium nematophilum]
MRDDERYPTVVDPPPGTTAPEVATGTYIDPQGRDKVLSDVQDPGMIPTYDEAQKEAVGEKAAIGAAAAAAGAVGTRGGSAPESIDKSHRKVCAMKRRTFLIVLAAVVFVLIGTIVGGTVGGIKANENKNNGNNNGDNGVGEGDGNGNGNGDDGSSDDSPTTTDTGPVPRKTGPIDADERFLAAAIAVDDDDENIQIFYNDLNTTNILYRRVHDDSGGPEHTLDLDIEPNYGTPLAATLRLASSVITTQLFYVTTQDNETQIAEVTLNCGNINVDDGDGDGDDGDDDDGDDDDDGGNGNGNANSGTAACSVGSNSIISSNLTNGVHPESTLAALRLGNDSVRVYFQASGTNIWALNGDNAADEGWSGSNLMGGVRPGSSIAATRSNTTDIHVFFVANQTGRMRTFNYTDVLGSDDSQIVDDQPGSSWRSTAFFDATYVPAFNSYQVFYTNPSSGDIVSYSRSGPSADWQSNNEQSWGSPASSVAAIAWEDQLRLFYYQSGRLTMSANDDGDWDAPEAFS